MEESVTAKLDGDSPSWTWADGKLDSATDSDERRLSAQAMREHASAAEGRDSLVQSRKRVKGQDVIHSAQGAAERQGDANTDAVCHLGTQPATALTSHVGAWITLERRPS